MMHVYFESMGPEPDLDECMTWAREQVQASSAHRKVIRHANQALDLIAGSKGNYDDKNKIDAKTVFVYTVDAVRQTDGELNNLFVEQLAEIVTKGSCAQGRTTRLWSIFYSANPAPAPALTPVPSSLPVDPEAHPPGSG